MHAAQLRIYWLRWTSRRYLRKLIRQDLARPAGYQLHQELTQVNISPSARVSLMVPFETLRHLHANVSVGDATSEQRRKPLLTQISFPTMPLRRRRSHQPLLVCTATLLRFDTHASQADERSSQGQIRQQLLCFVPAVTLQRAFELGEHCHNQRERPKASDHLFYRPSCCSSHSSLLHRIGGGHTLNPRGRWRERPAAQLQVNSTAMHADARAPSGHSFSFHLSFFP